MRRGLEQTGKVPVARVAVEDDPVTIEGVINFNQKRDTRDSKKTARENGRAQGGPLSASQIL